MAASAYVAALTMLARRELSERQIRQRLTRKGYTEAEIDDAVARLIAERSLDDARVAGALARTQLRLKKQGPTRVLRQLEAAGLAPAVARHAVDEAFDDVDVDVLLQEALDKRRRPGGALSDTRELARLYRALVQQGFDPDRVLALLRRRRDGHD